MVTDRQKECWQKLALHQQDLLQQSTRIDELFAQDPDRTQHFSLQLGKLFFDFSKNLLLPDSLTLLLDLAQAHDLESAIKRLFAGEPVNTTEQRPALHVALRGHQPAAKPETAVEISRCLERMQHFVSAIHSGNWRGFSGKTITDVVNIGIGGSDLGPAMAVAALRPWQVPQLQCHFVSNIDPNHLHNTLSGLNPETTLFIVASKSFTTMETRENAELARQWCLQNGADRSTLARHFVAVSSNIAAAEQFGIAPENVFPLWDWVGGRYSLWSAIGLVIALAIGMPAFRELLAGGRQADEHFLNAPLASNIPVIMGLLSIWYSNFWQAETHVVLPYWQNLALFPAYLQQLEMESLGKRVQLNGEPVNHDTGLILWGSAGTNGQHSFHQLLHQGTRLTPVDFIAVAQAQNRDQSRQHALLLANCFSQSQALMQGCSQQQAHAQMLAAGVPTETARQLAAHKTIPGNKPSNTFLLDQLDAHTLGLLIALYEHRVYVQSVIHDINAFDQWGVELGKQLSSGIFAALQTTEPAGSLDASTRELIRRSQTGLQQDKT
ncbi:MAG: glucose-6-phosphate isomerase [Pseudomonadales bacterium]|nr:glucose-6-phosphate isomerase [Pseudomonadales bacterium]